MPSFFSTPYGVLGQIELASEVATLVSVALTIAGSDPSGGAGLQADLKTFHQHEVYGMSVVTLLTVQNTRTVQAVQLLEPEFVLAQLDAVLSDICPDAIKLGALGQASTMDVIASRLESVRCPMVVDPVMISKHGITLLPPDAVEAVRIKLLPRATVVTPNRHEASALSGLPTESLEEGRRAATAILEMGPEAVLLKGLSLGDEICDLWLSRSGEEQILGPRFNSRNLHGTGCVLAASLTAHLARHVPLPKAARLAVEFVREAIQTGPRLGHGYHPTNMHVAGNVEPKRQST